MSGETLPRAIQPIDSEDIAEAKHELHEYRNEYFEYWDSTAETTKTGTV
jgi:hypothetical protein